MDRRRPATPFGGATAGRDRLRWAAVVAGVLAVVSAVAVAWPTLQPPGEVPGLASAAPPGAGLPAAHVTLPLTRASPGQRIVHLRAPDVQESCVGRHLPGDVESVGAPPSIIDGKPLTSWHCDGNGALLRPPQSVTVFFPRTVTLTGVGVVGYDPFRPCRFVTSMELVVGATGYEIRLPASLYPQLRWFAVPPVRVSRLELVVRQTRVPPGRSGPNCARTAIGEIGFTAQR